MRPNWGAGGDHPFFRDSGSRRGQPTIDILGGYAFAASGVARNLEATDSPAAAAGASFFIAGPLWGGVRAEWSRHDVERSGRPYYSVDAVSVMAQLEWRFREKNSRFGGYLNMGFGGNINLDSVVASPRLDDGTLIRTVDIKNTACIRSAIGVEFLLTERAGLLLDFGMKANQFASTRLVTVQPRTVLEGQNLSTWTLMGGARFYL